MADGCYVVAAGLRLVVFGLEEFRCLKFVSFAFFGSLRLYFLI